MSDTTADDAVAAKKPSKLPLIIGLVLALAGGGGGFFAVQSGLLGGGSSPEEEPAAEEHAEALPMPDVTFVEVPPLVVSLGPATSASHLRFRASLEVPAQYQVEVAGLLPRVQDVLNSYLRALDPADIAGPGALVTLRAQMLRRVKLVIGEARVRDLLVLEFVLD